MHRALLSIIIMANYINRLAAGPPGTQRDRHRFSTASEDRDADADAPLLHDADIHQPITKGSDSDSDNEDDLDLQLDIALGSTYTSDAQLASKNATPATPTAAGSRARANGSGHGNDRFEQFEIMDSPLPQTAAPQQYTARNRRTVLACILLEVFVVFSWSTTQLPFTRVVENSVCQRWFEQHADEGLKAGLPFGVGRGGRVPEEACKGDEIQSAVVEILGIADTISTIVALLVMFPAGYLATVIDRRAFLLLGIIESSIGYAIMGVIGTYPLVFDPRLVWFVPLLDFIGGGWAFFGIILRTVIAENVTKEDLGNVYYKLTAFNILAAFVGTSLGSWLMSIVGEVVVLYLGIALMAILSVPPIMMLPSSSPSKSMYDTVDDSQQHRYSEDDDDGNSSDSGSTNSLKPRPSLYQRLMEQAMSKQNLFASVKRMLLEKRAVRNALITLTLYMVSRGVRIPFQTWVSKRYSWTLSKTGIILSFESLLSALSLFALPLLRDQIVKAHANLNPAVNIGGGGFKRRRSFSDNISSALGIGFLPPDLLIAAGSSVALLVSTLMLTFTASATMLVLSLAVSAPGRAFVDGLRSHTITLVGEADIMLVHMAFTIVEIVAGIVNGPLWIEIYGFTYSEGNATGLGMGLPFAICAVVLVVMVVLVPSARR
ncbi:hypothetical protein Dda_3921 [Drechslerella dactyloides]|uniref:Major facilitator superfamily transporter n=1 Tax=Drechslerella dactyloides TaxID=74499 RepID=A0AAD6IYT1_DREDA|nr:hypothetical protein Dda_3921 [Drechslerella dactyloides]